MQRDRLSYLQEWRESESRKVLIIRGARQVGKSWLVREFGKEFDHVVEINFEKERSAKKYFEGDLDVKQICEKLSLHVAKKIEPGKTLLFLDEIQACEDALLALRYFKEDIPELHVIAAGSLLEFALQKHGLPVGRVQTLYLNPLSFGEYLNVMGYESWRHFLMKQESNLILQNKIFNEWQNYMWLGGMPAVVNSWLKHRDPIKCQEIQDELIEIYRVDFHKYARERDIQHVSRVFDFIPKKLGEKFIYSQVEQDTRSADIKRALALLEQAGIAKYCYHTPAQKPPLSAEQDNKKFKVFYFDLGIAQRLLGLDLKQWLQNPIQLSYQGGMAEQFVAQELIAYSNFKKTPHLHYWHREAKSSNAEVDFIGMKNGQIIPIEVKSNNEGRMKSMQIFLESHPESPYGLKISPSGFAQHNNIQEIPLYGIEGWLK